MAAAGANKQRSIITPAGPARATGLVLAQVGWGSRSFRLLLDVEADGGRAFLEVMLELEGLQLVFLEADHEVRDYVPDSLELRLAHKRVFVLFFFEALLSGFWL